MTWSHTKKPSQPACSAAAARWASTRGSASSSKIGTNTPRCMRSACQELAEQAGPTARVVDVGEDAQHVVGVLAPSAVGRHPHLGGLEHGTLGGGEREAAGCLVVGDEAVELRQGRERVRPE